jgi:hypothetical protein
MLGIHLSKSPEFQLHHRVLESVNIIFIKENTKAKLLHCASHQQGITYLNHKQIYAMKQYDEAVHI